jgi:hypothetical protein
MGRWTTGLLAAWLVGAGCAPVVPPAQEAADAGARRPPPLTDPAVLLADLVVLERTFTLDDVEALVLHLPPTRALTVEGRSTGEPMPSSFFELNGAVIGTLPTVAGVLVRVTVERSAEALVDVAREEDAVVADCGAALEEGALCWADVWAWVPTAAALTVSGEGTHDARVTELGGTLSVGLPWVHHLEIAHRGDAAVWLGEVDDGGHVQLCVEGEAEVHIDDGTEALPCR